MRAALILSLILAPALARADACLDRFAALLGTSMLEAGPFAAEGDFTVGGNRSVTIQRWLTESHSLIETVEPKGVPEVLHYDGGVYQPDGAGGWTLLYESPGMAEASVAMRAKLAAAAVSAECGEGEFGGAPQERIAGEVAPVPPFESPQQLAYYLDPESGRVVGQEMHYTASGMAVDGTFTFTPLPDLDLPKP